MSNLPITKINIEIIRKDQSISDYQPEKIIKAVQQSAARTSYPMDEDDLTQLLLQVEESLMLKANSSENDGPSITVDHIHDMVLNALADIRPDVHAQYSSYRHSKKEFTKMFAEITDVGENIKFTGMRENGNKNSDIIATQRALLNEVTMKKIVTAHYITPEWRKAHEEGWLYIHDLGDRWTQSFNCCIFDMEQLLTPDKVSDHAFRLNNMIYNQPNWANSALQIIGDMVLSASSNQYGGFTVPEIDTIISLYAQKTYNAHLLYYNDETKNHVLSKKLAKERTLTELTQGYQSIEYKLNSLSNALGQTPFVTFTFGMDTSFWGREFAKIILETRLKTENVVFPKLVYLTHTLTNRNKDSENYDIYKLALKTTRKRIYPDYLSLDAGHIGESYKKYGKINNPMGCRSYPSDDFFHPETGELIYKGRGNVSVVSINLTKFALEADGDSEIFYELIETYTKMALDINKWYHGKVSELKGSSNPLFWCEGGAWMSVGMDESVAPIVKGFTTSVGVVGVNQAVNALNRYEVMPDDPVEKRKIQQELGLQIVNFMDTIISERKIEDGIHHSLYGTPAESLCYTFNNFIREQYGIIEGVSDKEFQTNSWHIDVWEHITIPEKIEYEAPFHQIVKGGKIGYVELPYGVATSTLESVVNHAMDQGMYFGANVINATCNECGEHGDFLEQCPNCDSYNITAINRVCGYLSFIKREGTFRQNPGKISETMLRVDHTGYGQRHSASHAEITGESMIEANELDKM